eukprot:6184927-Pleurochrysis_carterae.AAC.2
MRARGDSSTVGTSAVGCDWRGGVGRCRGDVRLTGGEAAAARALAWPADARSALAANVPRAPALATTPISRWNACAARAIAPSSGVPRASVTARIAAAQARPAVVCVSSR